MKRIIFFIILATLLMGIHFPDSIRAQSIEAINLRCEYQNDPLGIDVTQPRLFWQIQTHSTEQDLLQSAYRIQVASSPEDFSKESGLLWDSEMVHSDQSIHVEYGGVPLKSRQKVYWRVRIWDNKARTSAWSRIAHWEMAFLDSTDWNAQWIGPDVEESDTLSNPSPMLRKKFFCQGKILKARLYITSHGLYEAHINGKKVGNALFTPGWTSFHKRLQYQVYDVTDMLEEGDNALGVVLGDGWYRGEFGLGRARNFYTSKLALLCQLEIEMENGEKITIISDDTWKSTNAGPIRQSSIYDGAFYDARMEISGWNRPGFNDLSWNNVYPVDHKKGHLVAQAGPFVRAIEEIHPVSKIITPKGEHLIDMGQNMVGHVKFRVSGKKGDTIRLYHAEILDKEGNFYTENLRAADQKVEYVFKGNALETYEPLFTFQGFRYVKVEGYPIEPEEITGIVVHSDMEQTGWFECSDSLVNQLQHNIVWGQKGNFLDVPTDCPQRDERLGWTGDAQIFGPTACFNFNTAPFFSKWLKDLAADQFENGSVPWVIPDNMRQGGTPGWGDASTIVPWTMYLKYGDRHILENQYASMKAWVDYLSLVCGDDLLFPSEGFYFGDWVAFKPESHSTKPGYTDTDFIGTAFYAHSANLVSKAARILGYSEEARKYEELNREIKRAFQAEYVSPNGRLSPNTQTAYVLSLHFGLLKDDHVPAAVQYLVSNIRNRNNHLSTGFLGTPYLCRVLSDHGHTDVAYNLLMQKTYPSWLYPVLKGATTIWERWDGIKTDGTPQDPGMNSYNHYVYGSIGDWLYSVVAGLNEDPSQPGYKHVIIKPEPRLPLSFARASYQSMYGKIYSSWEIKNQEIQIDIQLPPNTKGQLQLPQDDGSFKILEIGSGRRTFTYTFDPGKEEKP